MNALASEDILGRGLTESFDDRGIEELLERLLAEGGSRTSSKSLPQDRGGVYYALPMRSLIPLRLCWLLALLLPGCAGRAQPQAQPPDDAAPPWVLRGEVPARESWVPFSVPGCGVTVDLPAAPFPVHQKDYPDTALGERTSGDILVLRGNGATLIASCISLRAPVEPQAALAQARQELLQIAGQEASADAPLALGDHPGLSLRYASARVAGGTEVAARLYVVGDRLTTLQVVWDPGTDLSSFAEQVLSSARLTAP